MACSSVPLALSPLQSNVKQLFIWTTEVVGVLDGARMALTFHPELTTDRRFHRWLLAVLMMIIIQEAATV